MYQKELSQVKKLINKIQDDITNNVSADTDIKNVKTLINDLREALVGQDGNEYVYLCSSTNCTKHWCKLDLNCKLADPTFCMDSLSSGPANFSLVSSGPYPP